MKIKLWTDYKDYYAPITWPGKYLLSHPGEWRFSLDPHCYPSLTCWAPTLWNNVMKFLTPWNRIRRCMLDTFASRNGMKLLDDNRKFVYLRTRDENQRYYCLELCWFGARLTETQYVDDNDTPQNLFMYAIPLAFGQDDGSRLKEKTAIVCKTRFCMTRNQCQKFLDEIVEKTKDKIDWWPDKEEEHEE